MKTLIGILFTILFMTKFTFGQDTISCGYPLHTPIVSFLKYLDSDFKKKSGEAITFTTYWQDFFSKKSTKLQVKYDSAFYKCEDYLIKRLGKSFYCNYLVIDVNNFIVGHLNNQNTITDIVITFGFQLPNLTYVHRYGPHGYIHCQYEVVKVNFGIIIQSDSSLTIKYPKIVPECNGLPDCGFKVTRDSALSIAERMGFRKEANTYEKINTDGLNWNIEYEDKEGESWIIKIDLKTGAHSKRDEGQRID